MTVSVATSDPPTEERPMRYATRCRIAQTLTVVLAGCGGSGGGGGSPSIEGDYFAAGFEGEAEPVATGRASWGASAESDGTALAMRLFRNEDGAVSGPTAQAFDLVVDDEGAVRLLDPASGEAVLGGFAGEDGDVAIAASVRSGDVPRVLTLVRDSPGAQAVDLSGAYHFGLLAFDEGEGRSTVGRATFDGVGTGVFEAGAVTNVDGSITTQATPTPAGYAVSSDGVVEVGVLGGFEFQGGLLPAGELVVLGGSTSSSQGPHWMVLLPVSMNASDATFSGTYGTVAITFDRGFGAVVSSVDEAVVDGQGNVEFSGGTANVDGTLASAVLPGVSTYSVGANGTLTLPASGGPEARGGVSPSGRYAFVAGGVVEGSLPFLRLFVRR
jgi:hypothetical protein